MKNLHRAIIGLIANLALGAVATTDAAAASGHFGGFVGGHGGGFAAGYGGRAFGRGFGYGRGYGFGYGHFGYGGYGYRGFYPYGFYGGLALGLYFGALPLYYSTFYYGGIPYYYSYPNYYVYDGAVGQYVTVNPPAGLTAAAGAAPRSAATAPAAQDKLFAYPKNGQSADQQAKDRYECHRFAVTQTGFDPTQAGGGALPAKREDYRHAERACLEGHGYAVQ